MTKLKGHWHQPLLCLAPTTATLRGTNMASLDGQLGRKFRTLLSTSFETIPISRLCSWNDSQGDVRWESRQGLIPHNLSFFSVFTQLHNEHGTNECFSTFL